jgi:hypothetical protein
VRVMVPKCELHPDADSDPDYVGFNFVLNGERFQIDPCPECSTRIYAVLNPFTNRSIPVSGSASKKKNPPPTAPDVPGVKWMVGRVAHAERATAHATLDGQNGMCRWANELIGPADDATRRCQRCVQAVRRLAKQAPEPMPELEPEPAPEPVPEPEPEPEPVQQGDGKPLSDRIVQFVKDSRDPVSIKAMLAHMPDAGYENVRVTALWLVDEGLIKRDKSKLFSRVRVGN